MPLPQGQYGITPAISIESASARDIELTTELLRELKAHRLYESPDESRHRQVVLAKLEKIVKAFVLEISLARGLPETMAREAGGKIYTFGSYRLGVHGPGADIDTLCVVPKHVEREDWFRVFEAMLKETTGATDVTAVPEAFVPIIKMVLDGIDIDLLFARLSLPSIPDDLSLQDDNLLKNLDERCVRSLGGSRVTDLILKLVPDVAVFRIALRAIKLWAKKRAIYSNILGFCGGVAWAMLVARICQLYPKAAAGAIVTKFFRIFYQWEWPQPVLLKEIDDGPLQVRVWNPRLYPLDRLHRMPIITPAYPSMCSTHNVCYSTHEIMMQEFKRGIEVTDRVISGSAPWSELFESHDFFTKYRYYLQVIASAKTTDEMNKWAGTVESKLRLLVTKLEAVPNLKFAHPFINGFEKTFYCSTEDEARMVIIGEDVPEIAGRDQGDPVYTTTFYVGLQLEPKDPKSTQPRRLDISWPTNEFIKIVKTWDKYQETSMGLVVRHIKYSALPDSVFGQTARKPLKQLKRTKSGKNSLKEAQRRPNESNGLENGGEDSVEANSRDADETVNGGDSGPNKKRRSGTQSGGLGNGLASLTPSTSATPTIAQEPLATIVGSQSATEGTQARGIVPKGAASITAEISGVNEGEEFAGE